MTFPLGKPILAMILLAIICGTAICFRPRENTGDLVVWTFADSHARSFRGDGSPSTQPTLVQQYEQMTGRKVTIKLMSGQALAIRLNAIFDRDLPADDVPDLVEIEIGMVGRFFRPPMKHIGLLPLNDLLKENAWDRRLLKSRLAPWTKRGAIFGIPHDVHPISIAYRKDLYDQAGVDLETAGTWPEFQEKCLEFQAYWQRHGAPNRRAIELPSTSSDYVVCMLLQQHLNILDTENHLYLNEARVVKAVAFYARCVAGPGRIAGDATPGPNLWVRDFKQGDLCALIAPDWRLSYLYQLAPDLAGKVRMMPLPKFQSTDAPTATWGGTMMSIPRPARDARESWKLLQFLYFSEPGLQARRSSSSTLPPLMDTWSMPEWHQPDPYFGGQKVSEMYINLARQLPDRFVTPFTTIAISALSVVQNRAVRQVESGNDVNLESNIARWLAEADAEVRRRIEFGKFED